MKLSRTRTSKGVQFTTDRSPLMSRRSLLQYGGFVGAAVSSPWLLAACNVAGDPGSDAGQKRLSIRLPQDILNLDPAFVTGQYDDSVVLCVVESLMTYRPNSNELVPQLAAKLTSSDDGLTHEFRLKEGIQFHGGYGEVTAEDVKFSFERVAGLTDPPIKSTYRGDWASLEEVQVTGKYTGVIRLKEPFAPLFATTIPGDAGMIISRAAYEELGKDFATHPIGTGPYEFVHWQRKEEVLLRKFDKWGGASLEWAGEEPAWKEIAFQPIVEDAAARIAVETGDLDFGQIAYTDVGSMSTDERFNVTKQTTFDYGWVGFNVTEEKLSDVRVRRAIRQALDVDAMIAGAFDGQATRAYAILAPGMPIGYWKDAPKYQRDVNKAEDLLAAAGVDGLELEMTITSDEPGGDTVAAIVQANLKDIGIDVSIRKTTLGAMLKDIASLQMFYWSFNMQADPAWATEWFTSDQIGEWNAMSWSNKEFDSLHKAALTELDPDRRDQMYVRMQQIMDEDAVAAWVMYHTYYYAHAPALNPSLVTPLMGKYRAWDFEVERA